MSTSLNVGLMGALHALDRAELLKDAGYRVRAAADAERNAAESLACDFSTHETIVAESLDSLIASKDVDVVLASQSSLSADQVCKALSAGKHVVCELPESLTVKDTQRIAEARRTSGRAVAFLSSRLRNAGFTNLARQYMDTGRVGRVYRVELVFQRTPGTNSTGAVCLLDQALDLLKWPKIQSLCAHAYPSAEADSRGVMNNGTIYARLAGDIAVSLDLASMPHQKTRHSITILGDKGGLVIDHSDGGRGFSFAEEVPGMMGKLIESKPLFGADPWGSILKPFREHVLNGKSHPGTSPEQACELAAWVGLARQSAEQGRELASA